MEPWSTHASLLMRVRDPTDRRAWHEFDARYGDLIRGYCRSCGLQLSDCEDVRQLVMMQLAAALGSFSYDPARGRFRAYLRRVIRNAISRHFERHTARERGLDQEVLNGLAITADGPDDALWEQQWVRHHCRLALQTLRRSADPCSVEVFDHLLAGHTIGRTAEAFGMTPERVRKIKQRIKERLQVIVASQIRDEDGDAPT